VEGAVIDRWIEDGPVRVMFTYIGEGYSGDFDPSDPEDKPLLRLDVNVREDAYEGEPTGDDDWVYPRDGSICTSVTVETTSEQQERYLRIAAARLRSVVEHNDSVSNEVSNLSYLPDVQPFDTTCGTCGRMWNSDETPTPAARCPYEYEHESETDPDDEWTVVIRYGSQEMRVKVPKEWATAGVVEDYLRDSLDFDIL
jgi:hypothetical protein